MTATANLGLDIPAVGLAGPAFATKVNAALQIVDDASDRAVQTFHVVNDGIADDSAAVQAGMDSLGSAATPTGCTLRIPPTPNGMLVKGLHARRQGTLKGAAAAYQGYPTSWFKAVTDTTTLTVDRAATSADGGRGDGLHIYDLGFICATPGSTTKAILGQARFIFERLYIENYFNGIHVLANSSDGTNANKCIGRDSRIYGCQEWGMHMEGGDANYGEFANIDCSHNGWLVGQECGGIFDESSLGNKWDTCETSYSPQGRSARVTDSHPNGSIFVMHYSEGNLFAARLNGAAVIWIGVEQQGFDPAYPLPVVLTVASGSGMLLMRNGMLIKPPAGSGISPRIEMYAPGAVARTHWVGAASSAANADFLLQTEGGTPGEVVLRPGGVDTIRAHVAIADGQTGMSVRRNVGGTLTLQRVTMGAADSAGSGFKALRVPN